MIKTLVVDNDPVLLKAVSTILKQSGCDFEAAENGLAALELLETFQPDIIFTDLIMPNVNGEQFCKIIRSNEKYKDIFIVIISAAVLEDLDKILTFIDFDLCIAKGSLKELRDNIHDALRIYQSDQKQSRQVLGIESPSSGPRFEPKSITVELMTAKDHLTQMISSLSEGIVELTRDGKIVSLNNAAVEIFGFPEEKLIGSLLGQLDFANHQEIVTEWLKQLVSNKAEKLKISAVNPIRVNGKVLTASFLPIIERKNCFGIVILSDITKEYLAEMQKKGLENSFRLMKKMDAMSGMAGGVTHDFNNLLTVICGNLDLLLLPESQVSPNEQKVVLEKIQQAAYSASDLIKKISAFSNFGFTSRKKYRIGPVVNSIVKNFFDRNASYYELEIENPTSVVNIDQEQISIAINNVLKNSVEAQGGSKIFVKTSKVNLLEPQILSGQYVPTGEFVRIDIADKGVGIPEDKLLQVFDPYFSSKTRGSSKGTGLGLTVVYSTFRNHGGHVVVDSEAAEGTTVSLFLPLAGEGDISDVENVKHQMHEEKGSVLFMEEDDIHRKIGKIMLEQLGYRVTTVSGRYDVLNLFKDQNTDTDNNFKIAILSIRGHNHQGALKVCRELKELVPDIATVALTGAILDPIMKDSKKYHFDTTLAKPYTIDNLRDAIQRIGK